jgi:hypothetical protein
MREWCRPERGRRCFDQLPATLLRLLTGVSEDPAVDEPLLRERFARVVFVYFDAFGWTFLERHAKHPVVERARADGLLTQLTAQFPSTTTAQVTTIHSGLPVSEHGLYEWHVSFAGDGIRGSLLGQIDPDVLFPTDSLYARLADGGVRSTVVLPASIAGSAPNVGLLRGADVVPFETAQSALGAAATAVQEGGTYAHVYLDALDSLMHAVGTDDPAVRFVTQNVLDDLHRTTFPPGALVLLTADHGMSPVDPARTIYVNELWPELAAHLETGGDGKPLAPAGSCRDLFLHAYPEQVETVCAELGERLSGVADVLPVEELVAEGIFAEPSPRLRERLATVVVLPRHGEAVYWHERGRFEQDLLGQHGGLSPQEMEIPLVAWVA